MRKQRGETELDAGQFLKAVRAKLKLLDIGEDLLQRAVNVGFSGGEKKRNEIFQMAMLEPKLAHPRRDRQRPRHRRAADRGQRLNTLRGPDRAMVLITHYQRLLDYVVPDRVHVLSGRAHRHIRRQGTWRRNWRSSGYAAFGDAA